VTLGCFVQLRYAAFKGKSNSQTEETVCLQIKVKKSFFFFVKQTNGLPKQRIMNKNTPPKKPQAKKQSKPHTPPKNPKQSSNQKHKWKISSKCLVYLRISNK